MIDRLILTLSTRDALTTDEIATLESVVKRDRVVPSGEDIVIEGSRPTESTLLLDGVAARYRVLEDGKRQITALHVPGDFVDLHAFLLKTMDHSVVALSPCRIASAAHRDLCEISATNPHLTRMLWLSTVIDGAIHREWIVAIGRRSKKSHLAHLICELYVRLTVVGMVSEMSFHLPMSQAEVADALGVSLVHLNKTLQILRLDGVVRWVDRIVTILNWERLAEIAEFDGRYLNLSHEPR
ncbi:Crp/Fnr family transcriptional regulator [Pararhizobium arenae]|uniref:Crp/Fnr family transcriptional regulator n=1 Tax=Pararhizobium arenae TaxID=1856850 RepID=UPI00094AF964|nr:Crp/Fnr family transcriptional regulator [Pararhizobium arenae]